MPVKKLTLPILVILLINILFFQIAEANSVTGIRSLNNEERKIDYKLTREYFEEIADDVLINSNEKEIIHSSSEREVFNLTRNLEPSELEDTHIIKDSDFRKLTSPISEGELNWLIENNILSRESSLKINNSQVDVENREYILDRSNPKETINRTDFLMGIYKSTYGVINSRPLLIRIDSWRNAEEQYIHYEKNEEGELEEKIGYHPSENQRVSGTGKVYRYMPSDKNTSLVARFNEGDYYTYVSPNVPELYLIELLNKGIILEEQISDLNFREVYKIFGKQINGTQIRNYPRWYNGLEPYMVSSGRSQKSELVSYIDNTNVFGRSYTITGTDNSDRGYSSGTVEINKLNSISYFLDESLDSITALKYIESILRLTEKDMTDTEARIVTYKYGASYLNLLEEDDRKTVMFLTAKGILNFEDNTEYKNLYGEMTKEFAYKLMYRLANKNARLDFSQIQLTDSDNFWLNEGFSQIKIQLNFLDTTQHNELRRSDGTYEFLPIPDVETGRIREISSTVRNNEEKRKSIFGFKLFAGKSTFAEPSENKKTYEIIKVFDNHEKYKYKNIRLTDRELEEQKEVFRVTKEDNGRIEIIFRVEAVSPTMALSSIDSNIQIGTDYLFKTSSINAVTKFDDNDKEVILVPASMLREGNHILIVEDKLLKNVETGTTAILLQDENIALVGTHVIRSNDLMVFSLNGEIYYNLEIIRTLMSNAYISSLDPKSIYVSKGIQKEVIADVVATTGNRVGKTYIAKFPAPGEGGDIETINTSIQAPFVNISQLTESSNFLIKNFDVRNANNEIVSFKLIMHLVYKMPDKDLNFIRPVYNSSNPDFGEVNSFIYERPEDPELRDWWDNNIEISNAFANVIYGTRGVDYVKSGYLVPNITILYDEYDIVQEKHLTKLFQDVGSHLSDYWINRFIGDISTYNSVITEDEYKTYFDENNRGSIYYPDKAIPTGLFPKWVHAMFNNSSAKEEVEQIYEGVPSETPTGSKANTELWRYLMSNRNLNYNISKGIGSGIKTYSGDGQVYVVTNGDTVYRRISETDPKFNSKLVGDGKVLYDDDDWGNITKFVVKPQTRTEQNYKTDWISKTVYIGDLKFIVKGISGNKLQLVDVSPVSGKAIKSKRGERDFVEISGVIVHESGSRSGPYSNAIERRYNSLRTILSKEGILVGYENSVEPFDSAVKVTEIPSYTLTHKRTVFVDKGLKSIDFNKELLFFQNNNNPTWKRLDEVLNTEVRAHVMIEVDLNLWDISDQGELLPRRTFPVLQTGNIYFSGINQGVIDSIIMSHIGYKKANDLDDGSRLMIGDIGFTKKGDRFISDPQENINSWKDVIEDANNEEIVKNGVFKAFTGMSINVSNTPIALQAFIKSPSLGIPVSGMDFTGDIIGGGEIGTSSYVYAYREGKMTSKEYDNMNIPTDPSVVFSISLDDALLVRPVGILSNTYQLLFSTNTMSVGFLDKVPFFSERLTLSKSEDLYLVGEKVKFRPLVKAEELKDAFLKDFSRIFQGDLTSLLRMFGVTVISFMIVISWICFMILKFGLFYGILDILRNPTRESDRKGIDLVKLVSFGMFNLDSNISGLKLIFFNIVMFGVIYIILDVIPI